jgi:hypothetical protein
MQPKARNQTLLALVESSIESWDDIVWDFETDYVVAYLG